VDRVEVSTVVYLPPEEVYEFLLDFPGYADYSKYLREVRQRGEGGPGTRYALHFAWWKLTYTARSEVTEVEQPTVIHWELVSGLDAGGRWVVEHEPDLAPEDRKTASRVRFVAEFDPESADSNMVDIPKLVSVGWVLKKVKPLVLEEAERIVERIVADIEGESREIELTIHETPSSV
jgi:uncharacterized membrane protein